MNLQDFEILLDYKIALVAVTAFGVLWWGFYKYFEKHQTIQRFKAKIRRLEGDLMSKKGRVNHVKRILSDGINNLLDDLEEKGKITEDEKNMWMQQIGNTGLTDLLPRRRQKSVADVKQDIRERLERAGVNVDAKVVQLKAEKTGVVRKKYA